MRSQQPHTDHARLCILVIRVTWDSARKLHETGAESTGWRSTWPAARSHLRVSLGQRSWRPAPASTVCLWPALPAGRAGLPGSPCSRRHHGCFPTSSPSSCPSLYGREEAVSLQCCWWHFAAAGIFGWKNLMSTHSNEYDISLSTRDIYRDGFPSTFMNKPDPKWTLWVS